MSDGGPFGDGQHAMNAIDSSDGEELPPQLRRLLTALEEFHSGQPVTQQCVFCGTVLQITGLGETAEGPHTAWAVTCSCGRSNDTLRGL